MRIWLRSLRPPSFHPRRHPPQQQKLQSLHPRLASLLTGDLIFLLAFYNEIVIFISRTRRRPSVGYNVIPHAALCQHRYSLQLNGEAKQKENIGGTQKVSIGPLSLIKQIHLSDSTRKKLS